VSEPEKLVRSESLLLLKFIVFDECFGVLRWLEVNDDFAQKEDFNPRKVMNHIHLTDCKELIKVRIENSISVGGQFQGEKECETPKFLTVIELLIFIIMMTRTDGNVWFKISIFAFKWSVKFRKRGKISSSLQKQQKNNNKVFITPQANDFRREIAGANTPFEQYWRNNFPINFTLRLNQTSVPVHALEFFRNWRGEKFSASTLCALNLGSETFAFIRLGAIFPCFVTQGLKNVWVISLS
jgi:hypothetical protein